MFLVVKMKIFIGKKFDFFFKFIFAKNIFARRGGSNEYPQSMFWSKNKKISIPLQTPVLLYKSGVQGGI